MLRLRNFTISKQNAKAFTKLMTSSAKPLLPHNFKSTFVNLNQHPQLKQEINEAMENQFN